MCIPEICMLLRSVTSKNREIKKKFKARVIIALVGEVRGAVEEYDRDS